MSAYLLGLLTIPLGLAGIALCAAIFRATYLLFGSVLRVGVVRFGVRNHQPVINMLERHPDEVRTAMFSRGRFALILIADRKETR